MRRREFIALFGGAAVTWPFAVRAQQGQSRAVIGVITISSVRFRPYAELFVQGLRQLGWVEGRNIDVEYRYTEGSLERVAEAASEFVRMKVDVIVTGGDREILTVKQATPTIPIVFAAAGDPVGNGIIASLARPGGNITGLSMALSETAGKRLELLREVVPSLSRVALIGNFQNPMVTPEKDAVLTAAHMLGLETITIGFRTAEDIPSAIEPLRGRAEALYVCADPLMVGNVTRINAAALGARLPIMHSVRNYVEAGGLISYGPDYADLWRRVTDFIDKILRGIKPADIPTELPTKFYLAVNLKTAKALGLAIPESFLTRADEVIEE